MNDEECMYEVNPLGWFRLDVPVVKPVYTLHTKIHKEKVECLSDHKRVLIRIAGGGEGERVARRRRRAAGAVQRQPHRAGRDGKAGRRAASASQRTQGSRCLLALPYTIRPPRRDGHHQTELVLVRCEGLVSFAVQSAWEQRGAERSSILRGCRISRWKAGKRPQWASERSTRRVWRIVARALDLGIPVDGNIQWEPTENVYSD